MSRGDDDDDDDKVSGEAEFEEAHAREGTAARRSADPRPPPTRETLSLDAKDPHATFRPIEPLPPPAGALNVLVVLIDDPGVGSMSAFGGPCQTRRRSGSRLKASSSTASMRTALCWWRRLSSMR